MAFFSVGGAHAGPSDVSQAGETQVEDEIIYQGPGYTIARTYKAETLVPYGRAERPEGAINHGWIDLCDHPERVAEIPEAKRSVGLSKLLRVIADPASEIMSSACECCAFELGAEVDGPRWHVGGFVMVMFRDADRNVDAQNLVDMARYILSGISASSKHHVGFEMIVEPLKFFFGRTDCHALMLKTLGYGADEAEAWAAFDYAAGAAADTFRRDSPENADDAHA